MKKKEHKSKSQLWRILLVLLSFSFSTIVHAQNLTVTGTVEDQNGEPLIGVTVSVVNTTNGGITDIDGNFSIKCAKGATLKFSYVGYKDETKVVTGSSLKVILTEDSQALDEVVVVGYGVQRKRDLSGSIASVKGDIITEYANTSVASALQGRVSGVQIQQTNGQPGAGIQVRVRGSNSIRGDNEPLWICLLYTSPSPRDRG